MACETECGIIFTWRARKQKLIVFAISKEVSLKTILMENIPITGKRKGER